MVLSGRATGVEITKLSELISTELVSGETKRESPTELSIGEIGVKGLVSIKPLSGRATGVELSKLSELFNEVSGIVLVDIFLIIVAGA